MAKYTKKIAYIVLIVILIILGYVIYSNATKDNEEDLSNKLLSEIRYLDSELIYILNSLNNISSSNYKITTNEVKDEKSSNSSSSSSSSSNSEGGSGESSSSSENSGNSTKNEEYNLKQDTILLDNSANADPDWDKITQEIQKIYVSIPTITLDLYQTDINQEDILNFNKNLDNITENITNKDKEKILEELSNMYSYLPKFLEHVECSNLYYATILSKSYIVKGYSKLDKKEWDKISADIQDGINNYSTLLTTPNIEEENKYNVNKTYVMLNELKNAANTQNKGVFLIKYKNILEEMDLI